MTNLSLRKPDGMTDEDFAAAQRINEQLIKLGRLIVNGQDITAARKAMEDEGVALSAIAEQAGEVMIVASFRGFRLPMLAATPKAVNVAAQFSLYREPSVQLPIERKDSKKV